MDARATSRYHMYVYPRARGDRGGQNRAEEGVISRRCRDLETGEVVRGLQMLQGILSVVMEAALYACTPETVG